MLGPLGPLGPSLGQMILLRRRLGWDPKADLRRGQFVRIFIETYELTDEGVSWMWLESSVERRQLGWGRHSWADKTRRGWWLGGAPGAVLLRCGGSLAWSCGQSGTKDTGDRLRFS